MASHDPSHQYHTLPPPWDRIFSLGSRLFVWTLLLAVLYVLRPFFLLIFLTFVFAYIQAHGVDGLAHRIRNRPLRVVIVGLVFLGTLFATGFSLAPEVREQAESFLRNKEKYVAEADLELNKFLKRFPSIYESLARHQMEFQVPAPLIERRPLPAGQLPEQEEPEPAPPSVPEELHLVRDLVAGIGESLTKNPLAIGQQVLGVASSFLLSLLFSFLIVLDLPKIRRGVASLAHTRVGFIYDEVAESLATFGKVLGRALEAQLFIAVCNTILTAVGVWLMGLPNLLVLSAIVFFCSFIPVVGTFISSTPICLLALQGGGVSAMVLAIVLITVIHALETYVLNPQIYGHHMHMNPVLVLIVLTIGGKLFGIWGLVLGIPIVNYFFRHAIRRPEPAASGSAA